jgi:hypothetical protein
MRVRFRAGYFVGAVGYMVGILLVSSSVGELEAGSGPMSELPGKVLHVLLFAGLAACLLLGVSGGRWLRQLSWQIYGVLGGVGVGCAALGEWHQALLAGHSARVHEIAWNASGIAVLLAIHCLVERRRRRADASAATGDQRTPGLGAQALGRGTSRVRT